MTTITQQLADALRAVLPYALNEVAAIHDCARKDGSDEAQEEGEAGDACIEQAEQALADYDTAQTNKGTVKSNRAWREECALLREECALLRKALAAYDAQQAVTPSDSGPFVGGLHIELFGDDESPDADAHGYALQSNGTRICDGLEEDHARRIVQCVNAHDTLVSALRTILADKGSASFNDDLEAYDAAIQTASDALAQAGVTP